MKEVKIMLKGVEKIAEFVNIMERLGVSLFAAIASTIVIIESISKGTINDEPYILQKE